jgi:hypothetical protein
MADAAAVAAAAALQQRVSRTTLQEAVKSCGGKDLAAWASLIRYDAILAAASPSPVDAYKVVDRLCGQAYLANKDTVKQQPGPYISLTLDQARANV